LEEAKMTLNPPIVTIEQIQFLANASRWLIQGSRILAEDGTVLYTPDGKGNYRALWTRDFAYMVENAGDLIPAEEIEACIEFTLKGQRPDGTIPDRVQPDGTAVYAAGPTGAPVGEPNLDNAAFLVISADNFLATQAEERRQSLARKWVEKFTKGMETIPISENGLVYNDPVKPHSPYGFTDTVGKTGELLFESLLYWTACLRVGQMQALAGVPYEAQEYQQRAARVEENLGVRLWDESVGAFLAATVDCRQIDIWGNAFAIWLNFPLGERKDRVLDFLAANREGYLWQGQVRHLLQGEHWQRLLIPVEVETYQNGAFWATASGWVAWALAQRNPAFARDIYNDLIGDFKSRGIYECVNEGYAKLETYVNSATNPLGAARRF
jgi:hypothetical protein